MPWLSFMLRSLLSSLSPQLSHSRWFEVPWMQQLFHVSVPLHTVLLLPGLPSFTWLCVQLHPSFRANSLTSWAGLITHSTLLYQVHVPEDTTQPGCFSETGTTLHLCLEPGTYQILKRRVLKACEMGIYYFKKFITVFSIMHFFTCFPFHAVWDMYLLQGVLGFS